jgi:chemotaxis protein MotA
MLFIIGLVLGLGAIVTGYLMHGGNLAVLWQPSEYIIIFGAAVGALIIANPAPVLKGVVGHGLKTLISGNMFSKKDTYLQLLGFFFELSKLMRTKGIKEVEQQIDHPHDSALFQKYPALHHDHHVQAFICDNVRLIVMGSGMPNQLDELMDEEIHLHHTERAAVVGAIQGMADGMPALGIVAAVLGVIITMGSITEPPEILGKLIGAALVGTFFGVMFAYVVLGPVGKNIEAAYAAEGMFYMCVKVAIVNFARQLSPQMIAEFTRKHMNSVVRPSFQEAEEYLNKIGSGGEAKA